MDELIQEATGNKIVIFHCPNIEDRKKIYSYLDKKFPNLPKGGIRLEQFEAPVVGKKKCPSCYNFVYLTKYHFGYMQNNQDESTSGDCFHCGRFVSHEPNFDMSIPYVRFHNAIVIGQILRWSIRKFDSVSVSDEEVMKLFTEMKCCLVELPRRSFGKKTLAMYLSQKKDLFCLDC
jgi:hypothetical protein